jgi:hypothetical protein
VFLQALLVQQSLVLVVAVVVITHLLVLVELAVVVTVLSGKIMRLLARQILVAVVVGQETMTVRQALRLVAMAERVLLLFAI